jgi:hypothetical protein
MVDTQNVFPPQSGLLLGLKKEEILTHDNMWMSPGHAVRSEVSQAHTHKN